MIKNILFVNTGSSWRGLEKFHYKTADKFQLRGYNIFILAKKETLFYNKCKKNGFNVTSIKHIGDATFINPLRVYWLVNYLKTNNIDAMFLAQSSHFKYGSVAGKIAGTKRIIYRRALAKPIKNKFYNRLFLKYFITDFMSISISTKEKNLEELPKGTVDENKINVIYKGVEKDKYLNPKIDNDIKKEFNIQEDEILVANIGSLCRQKAQQYLLRAIPRVVKNHTSVKFIIIGEGEKEKEFKQLAKDLNIEEKVIFTGFRNDIPSILKQIDFMAHTAIYEGGAPWVILEAMMVGVPIVSTEALTIPEFVIDGETGYIAENRNSDDIADKILKMINNKNRDKFGKRAAEIAKKNYTFEKSIDDIEEKIFNKDA